MSIFAFSQTNYPRKIKWERDTCVVITFDQLKVINQRLLHRRYLLKLNDSLSQYSFYLQRQLQAKDSLLVESAKIREKYCVIAKKLTEEYKTLAEERNKLIQQKKRRKKWTWIGVGVSFVTGFLLAK